MNRHRKLPRAYAEGLEGNTVHQYTEEALASQPGEASGEGTVDKSFTTVEAPPLNHPDVDTTKDPVTPSYMENEDVVLERYPELLQTIEKDSKDEEEGATGKTAAILEDAGIIHRRRLHISTAPLEPRWYETKVSRAYGSMNMRGKHKLHCAIVEHQLAELEVEAWELQCRKVELQERRQVLMKLEENLDKRLKFRESYAQEVAVEEKEVEEIAKRVREKQIEIDSGLGLGGARAETPSSSFPAAYSPPKPFGTFVPNGSSQG